jgi:hypothetical protein
MAAPQVAMRVVVAAGALMLSESFAGGARGQNPPTPSVPPPPAIVSGVFVDSAGTPIPHGVLSVVGESLRVVADSQGRFRLAVPGGLTVFAARALGYRPVMWSVSLEPGQRVSRRIELQPLGVALPAMTIVGEKYGPGRLAGFYQRRRIGLRLFLVRDSIERRTTNAMADLFVGRPGIRVFQDPYDPTTSRYVLSMRCEQIGAYVDGFRLPGNSSTDVSRNLSLINPADVEAIEVYRGPSELPADFMADACAAIVIWTRT